MLLVHVGRPGGLVYDYDSAVVRRGFDPVLVLATLADSGRFNQFCCYERDGVGYFAGDAVAEVILSDGVVNGTPAASPLRDIGRALAESPVRDWHAYGLIEFELAAAHLFVPRVEVEVHPDHALLRGIGAEALREVHDIVTGEQVSCSDSDTRGIDVRVDAEWYQEAVRSAVRDIREGKLQKVILSRPVAVPFPVDLTATYLRGRTANTPARSFLLDLGGWRAAGFSPETVLEVGTDGAVSTQPLAGTRAYGRGGALDGELRSELSNDPKEIFEHAIAVKLAHDELAGVCEPSTVAVRQFLNVLHRGSVQHLASRVSGTLSADCSGWDALQAVFPAVTASGAPKLDAYRVISALETEHRGLYAGAVLRATADGTLDAALALRTVFEKDGRAWLRAGAGIVGDSRPAREFEETCEKLHSVAPYLVPRQGS